MNLLIISTTKGTNLTLGNDIQKVAEKLELSSEVISLEDFELPLYNPTQESKGIPNSAKELSKKFQDYKALVFLAPEYNGSIPPMLSNAIAWISRTGENWRESFNGKLGIVGTRSGGGGQKVIMSMRIQLEHLGVFLHPRPIIVNSGKEFNPQSCETILNEISTLLSK